MKNNNENKNMFETKDCIIGGEENSDDEKLGSIFGSKKFFYEIPNYQRPYNWKTEQLEELWEDIIPSFYSNKSNNNYYLGSIIGIKNGNKIEIVDGQQRLTTILILFYVIKKLTGKNDLDKYIYYNKKDKKLRFETGNGNSGVFDDIFERENWYDYIKKIKEIEKYSKEDKREAYKNIRKEAILDGINIFEKEGHIYFEGIKGEVKKRENVKATFYNTVFFFYQRLQEFDKEQLEKFKEYILNKIHFNRIICSTRADGLEMFQVVNDRGLELSSSDLIKTYLLKEAPKGKQKAFEDDYNIIKQNVKEADVSLDEFFVIYLYYDSTKNPKRGVIKEFRDIILANEYSDLLSKLTETSNKIKKIAEENDWRINCLRNLPWKQYIWAILLCEREHPYKNLDEINLAIMRYYYLYWISRATINTIKTQSFTLMGKLKNGDEDIIESLYKELRDKGIVFKDEKSKKEVFRDNREIFSKNVNKIGEEPFIKSLLMLIEYAERKDTKTDIKTNIYIDVNKKEVQLEHILPQKYESNPKDWKNWKNGDKYINKLGNLTLLKGEKNLAASTKGLSDKIEIYEKNSDSYFKITADICRDYKGKEWKKQDIDNRTGEFIELLEKQLDVKLKTDKI